MNVASTKTHFWYWSFYSTVLLTVIALPTCSLWEIGRIKPQMCAEVWWQTHLQFLVLWCCPFFPLCGLTRVLLGFAVTVFISFSGFCFAFYCWLTQVVVFCVCVWITPRNVKRTNNNRKAVLCQLNMLANGSHLCSTCQWTVWCDQLWAWPWQCAQVCYCANKTRYAQVFPWAKG